MQGLNLTLRLKDCIVNSEDCKNIQVKDTAPAFPIVNLSFGYDLRKMRGRGRRRRRSEWGEVIVFIF